MNHEILNNHYNGNTTFIVGDWIKNGCTNFNIVDINKICEEHEVDEDMKQEVIRIHSQFVKPYNFTELLRAHNPSVLDWDHDCDDIVIRELIALNGHHLDILSDDAIQDVIIAVVKQDYDLERHIQNDYWAVRTAVAYRGYGLDRLVNDKSCSVRTAVASKGYGLDVLINDRSSLVRREVARQKYGLDILVNDKK